MRKYVKATWMLMKNECSLDATASPKDNHPTNFSSRHIRRLDHTISKRRKAINSIRWRASEKGNYSLLSNYSVPGIVCAFCCFIFPTTIRQVLLSPYHRKMQPRLCLESHSSETVGPSQWVPSKDLRAWTYPEISANIYSFFHLGLVLSRTKGGQCWLSIWGG